MKRIPPISVHAPQATKDKLATIAKLNRRSSSAEALILIEQHITAHRALLRNGGRLPKP